MEATNIFVIQIRNGNQIVKEITIWDHEINELDNLMERYKAEYPFHIFQILKPYIR